MPAVIASSNDKQLYVVMDDGTMHILDTQNPNRSNNLPLIYEPGRYAGYERESRSSVSLFEDNEDNDVSFAVFAVIYSPRSVQEHEVRR